jgi:hypothetical protein
LFGFVSLVAACTVPGAHVAPAEHADAHLYDRERFTVVTTHSGVVTGTTTTYVRDWGRHQAILNDTILTMGDVTEHTHNRVVIDGARIITIDGAGATTGMTISDYAQVRAQWPGLSAHERIERQFAQGETRRTGETGVFAGEPCEYWAMAPEFGQRMCMTAWGFDLYRGNTVTNVHEETATEVLIGNGGPDSAFVCDASRVIEVSPSSQFPPASTCEQRGSVLDCSTAPH